jgi:hypothetical protein
MPERFRLNTSAEMIHKVFTPPGENNIVTGWMGYDVPVAQKPPLLDRLQLPDPSSFQAEQLARNAFINPDNDLAAVVQAVVNATSNNDQSPDVLPAEVVQTQQDVTVVFSASDLIDSYESITKETIAFVAHLKPDIAVVEDDGETKVIVQAAGILSKTYNDLTDAETKPLPQKKPSRVRQPYRVSPIISPVAGDLD